MSWESFVSWRYLVAKRKEKFISLISLISILGIALGVMALIVVIAVMNGFDKELREKIVSINPHILIERQEGIDNLQELYAMLDSAQHVVGASAFINGQALFKSDKEVTGVLLRGIDPRRERKVTNLEKYLKDGSLDLKDGQIIIGSELAKRFYISVGDEISIVSSYKAKEYKFQVAGIFTSGMYEYDLNLVLVNINDAQKIYNLEGKVAGVGVRLDNLYQAKAVRKNIQETLGYPYWVRDWISLNSNLFGALKLEKTAMFVIVALIVVVACFNIAGTLIMMVMEKTKDIGILKAIGANNRAIKKVFTLEGLTIGVLGTVLGAGGGILLCHLLDTYQFIHLPRDIYYIDSLPVEMRIIDSIIIVGSALAISLLATVYPARQAAKLNPAETLRYE
ncbi:MAG: lipoprotein-releasing ABC transporter permease subunit [Candidatus Omnitrophica bacterium]|nr:lipoprotein-releasing ABC transporter permease subunit [Candidatus Omnitrophota bacterium]